MTLWEARIGKPYRIKCINNQGALRIRLLEMGLLPQSVLTVRKMAPLKDSLELMIRSYMLVLRKLEASYIEIEEVEK